MGKNRFGNAEKFFNEILGRASESFQPKAASNFDATALFELRDLWFDEGHCSCTFPVTERVSNQHGTLHGGCTVTGHWRAGHLTVCALLATLVDTVTTGALLTVSKSIGVSVHLSVSYFSGTKIGDDVKIDAQVLRVGNTLAYLQADLSRVSDGKRVAKGEHIKFLPGTEWRSKL